MGATLSDKTARKEFKLTQDEIIHGIRVKEITALEKRKTELVRGIGRSGPQHDMIRGRVAVVAVSKSGYDRPPRPRTSLDRFLASSPLAGSGLVVNRDRSKTRKSMA